MSHLGFLDTLDPEQKSAAESSAGLLVVIAGAGCGKTRCLSSRAAVLLSRTKCADSIVACTFTRSASDSLKRQVIEIGIPGAENIRFGTIHSLAASYLRKNPTLAGLKRGWTILSEDESKDVLKSVVNDMSPEDDDRLKMSQSSKLRLFFNEITRLKENGVGIHDLGQCLKSQSIGPNYVSVHPLTFEIYREYEITKLRLNSLDFGDLAIRAVRAMVKNPSSVSAFNVKHLLVDEWQDTNRAQLDLVDQLVRSGSSLSVVGDDDQSLYAFRGALPNLMENTPSLFPFLTDVAGCDVVYLRRNRRSGSNILSTACCIANKNPRSHLKTLTGVREQQGDVDVRSYAGDRSEGLSVAYDVEQLIASGVPPREIAILSRNRITLKNIEKAFLLKSIPHKWRGGFSLIRRSVSTDIMSYLKLALNPYLDIAFKRIASRPARGLGPTAVMAISGYMADTGSSVQEALAHLIESEGVSSRTQTGARKMCLQMGWLENAGLSGTPVREIVEYIISDEGIGYKSWLASKKGKDDDDDSLSVLADFCDLTSMQEDLAEFLTMAELSASVDDNSYPDGMVYMGTLHGCKGLEWDYVFITGMEANNFPSPTASRFQKRWSRFNTGDPSSIFEERRLLHVGLTRARKSVRLCYTRTRRAYGRPVVSNPSPFFGECELLVPSLPPIEKGNKRDTDNPSPTL
ncbi:ATP-dependent helicase [Acetobacter pasteurianus]|uniref:ATP-dependent helicase n=1 Tax=Acetobacter pasteurianus TaxID=438 RepID=UPI0013642FD6|nr:ATP-dependent helicase [Acetobacter pasteurianus]QHM90119.1 ATP-dependent helicase [Acetobacter pasteurianus]